MPFAIACAAALCGAALPGCSWLEAWRMRARRDGPHPMLAAARAHHINMFGELDHDRGTEYLARSSVSLRRHTFTEVGGDGDVTVDPGGWRIAFASTRHSERPDLYVKAVEGVAVTQLTSDPAADVQPAFSPDGRRIAFASDRSGQWDIWVIEVEGGQPLRVTASDADEIHPSWSPDGRQIVYCSLAGAGAQWELWITDADAGASRKFIGYGLFPEWSPHGDAILYQRARERGSRRFSVWSMPLTGGEPGYPSELASSSQHAYTLPAWSADGERVAFSSVTEMPAQAVEVGMAAVVYDVWVMQADGRGLTRLTDGYSTNYAPSFGRDGRIFFISNRSGHDNVWSLLADRTRLHAEGTEHLTDARAHDGGVKYVYGDDNG